DALPILKIFDLEMLKVRRIRVLSFLQGITLSFLRLSILFALLWLIFRDVLSPGELIAMQFISTAIFMPLQEIGNVMIAYREVESAMQNYDLIMSKPIERRPAEVEYVGPVNTLRFDNVVF